MAVMQLAATTAQNPRPRLADDVDLIGPFEGSGLKEPPFIARRADGQVVQMAPIVFAVAEAIDGERTPARIAECVSQRVKRDIPTDLVTELIEGRLRPHGVVAPSDGSNRPQPRRESVLGLQFKTKVIPDSWTWVATAVFRPLFVAPMVWALVIMFAALNAWLFGVHGIGHGMRHILHAPELVLVLVAGVVTATAFHELGHATACRVGGARPGAMGAGIYITWPVFYTDITDSYRLDRRGRLRSDLGGMYFNAIFALVVAAVYFATGFEPLLLLVALQTIAILQQALPLLRFDGYYVLSDLAGVPDVLMRVRPILASLIPGREADRRVTELTPRARAVVTAYVLTIVPLIALAFAAMLVNAPRYIATAYHSFVAHFHEVGPSFGHAHIAGGALALFQMVVLALPVLGLVLTTLRVGRQAGQSAWGWAAGRASRRLVVIAVLAVISVITAWIWGARGNIG
jgi:putative peptide zinc metalloprotease protein